jgi:hypothetical protein
LRGTIDELLEADVVGEIFGLIAGARKIGDRLGVGIESLAGFERAKSIPCLRNRSPVCALEAADRGA